MFEINQIFNGDCLELMKDIPDGSVDAIITDLPYGTTRNQWDSVIPIDMLWKHYKRLIKSNGAIVLFSQQPFTSVLVASNLSMFKYEWIWEKEMGTGFLNANYAPLKSHENIVVFSKGSAAHNGNPMSYNPQMEQGKAYTCKQGKMVNNYDTAHMVESIETKNDGKRYPKTVLKFNRDKDNVHPTQKPVELLRYLIRTYTNEGETVLDSCCGSGTTAIAAIREKRNFLCIEKDPHYYHVAKKRIETELQQLKLFLI